MAKIVDMPTPNLGFFLRQAIEFGDRDGTWVAVQYIQACISISSGPRRRYGPVLRMQHDPMTQVSEKPSSASIVTALGGSD